MTTKLCLKSIRDLFFHSTNSHVFPCDLLPKENPSENELRSFFIPSFQRGFRWTELQVEQLIKDLLDFHANWKPGDWYCLQPLVVVKGKEGKAMGKWVVIDGQQRLTTLFLLLKYLTRSSDSKLFENKSKLLEYETRDGEDGRDGSWDFLVRLGTDLQRGENKNPDFFCMYRAWTTMENCLKGNNTTCHLCDTILDYVKVIWYETEGDPYEEFNRLNSGKIFLSNAELMKALLLKENLRDGRRELPQLEAAQEWDLMEHSLQNDDFWCFINPSPTDKRFDATRLDFVFEMVLRMDMLETNAGTGKYFKAYCEKCKGMDVGKQTPRKVKLIDELAKNPSYIFGVFQAYSENPRGAIDIWHAVQGVFRLMRSWFENHELFHKVGYLMNRKDSDSEKKLSNLAQWLKDAGADEKPKIQSKKKLIEHFNDMICKSIPLPIWDLSYGQTDEILQNVLLLFNISILMHQREAKSRYPFREHKYARWTLEHIHAKQERGLNETDMLKIARYLGITDTDNIAGKEKLAEVINEKLEDIYLKGNSNFQPPRIELQENVWKIFDRKDTNGLGNLALLGHRANSSFNNALYYEKRLILAQWLRGDYESTEIKTAEFDKVEFVPRATIMTFFKQFSPEITCPFLWTEDDANQYIDVIVKTLSASFGFIESALRGKTEPQEGESK